MLLRTLALCALSGCTLDSLFPDDDTLPECSVADTSAIALVASDGQRVFDIADGAQVPLLGAPQGGHILLVGARVKTASACQLTATAALRDTTTQRVLGLEERPLLLDERADGWAVPPSTLDAMPNVAVCPSAAATSNVYDHEYRLELTLSKSGRQLASLSAMITPTCSQNALAFCQSDCQFFP